MHTHDRKIKMHNSFTMVFESARFLEVMYSEVINQRVSPITLHLFLSKGMTISSENILFLTNLGYNDILDNESYELNIKYLF